jgi:hypothetical protein
MQRAHTLEHPADYLLRGQHNRCSPQGGKLRPAVQAAMPLGDIECTLPERLNRPACAVRQMLYARPVDRFRWEIDTLFSALKNGCRVESLQLGHARKLGLALVIYLFIAWRLAHLTRLASSLPEQPASAVFEQTEWQAVWLLAAPPRKTPTLREVIRYIAMLGGFLARKGDGEPGIKTLWQSFARLSSFVREVEQMRSIHAL